ncbi:VOC family protein [Streptomyces sp. NPDC056831]|uniref:VOC family protein n=1 Tax=Streptomyces sp. NPDC056831 TaxID=3345954 RepID=UPI0036BA6DA6
MPTLEKIRPVTGAPCWVNLMAQDLRTAQSFYTDVMDWKFRESILGSNFSAVQCRSVAGQRQVKTPWPSGQRAYLAPCLR